MESTQGLIQVMQKPMEGLLDHAHSKMEFDRLERKNIDIIGTSGTFNNRLNKF